jgi:hypothetical protein
VGERLVLIDVDWTSGHRRAPPAPKRWCMLLAEYALPLLSGPILST